jgi:hypothetical protein
LPGFCQGAGCTLKQRSCSQFIRRASHCVGGKSSRLSLLPSPLRCCTTPARQSRCGLCSAGVGCQQQGVATGNHRGLGIACCQQFALYSWRVRALMWLGHSHPMPLLSLLPILCGTRLSHPLVRSRAAASKSRQSCSSVVAFSVFHVADLQVQVCDYYQVVPADPQIEQTTSYAQCLCHV